jgi:uncharacterized membrane protein YhfC
VLGMTNPFLLLSGIGMMLVAVIAFLYWRKKAPLKFFAWGALIWILAVAVKFAMDYTISIPIQQALLASYPLLTVLIIIGLYLGIRTGLFESGFTYIAVLKTKLRKMNFSDAVAFGIGFGGIEAFLLGFFSFIDILMFILFPDMLSALSVDQQAAVLSQLSLSTWIIFAPIIERISVLFIHIFAALLVVYSVKEKKPLYFLASFLYKTVTDGMIPLLVFYVGTATILDSYVLEIPVVILGIIGYMGIRWIMKKFKHPVIEKPKKPVKKLEKPVKKRSRR